MKALILLEHDDGTQTSSVVEDVTAASIDLDRVHIEGLVRYTTRSKADSEYVTVLTSQKRPEAAS